MVIVNDFHSCYYKPELEYHEEDSEVYKSKYHFRWSSPKLKHHPHFLNFSKAAGDSITAFCQLPLWTVQQSISNPPL